MQRLLPMPCFVAVCLIASVVRADNWPRFRGPNGSGVAATAIPAKWGKEHVKWTADLPGDGISSPVVWGTNLFVTCADVEKGQRYLVCIDTAGGKVRWKHSFAFRKYRKHKNNSFASNTPVCDAERVYVLWQSKAGSSLEAFGHDGRQHWKFAFGAYNHGQGSATSPIVHGKAVLFANDQKGDSFLTALDNASGRLLWKVPREGKRACYATPCVVEPEDGKPQIVFSHCYEGVIGVDPASGKTLWKADPFGRNPQRALASPVVAGDLVLAGSGAVGGDRHIVAIRPAEEPGDKAEETYRITRSAPHVPTPLVHKNRVYLWSDGGIVTCADAAGGKVVWRNRVGGNFFGSPVCDGEKLFCVDTDGRVCVIAVGDKFTLLARNELGEGSKSTPAIANSTLYVRTNRKVHAIGAK